MKHCLVVDDSNLIRKVARKYLEELHLQVSEAEDGAIALSACRKAMPDAILLDWNMPNMTGIEFLGALRKTEGGERPIVVLCTTENELGFISRALEAGANEYIMKPFDKDILEEKLKLANLI